MSVCKKGIAWLIVPFNYANNWRSVDIYGYHIPTFHFIFDDIRERPLLGTGCRQVIYDIEAIIYFFLHSWLKQIVEILSPLSITYDKITSEFKSNEFIFQNADNHHNDYFLSLVYHRHFC